MNHSITLTDPERNTLLDWYRQHPDPSLRLRCHLILLLAEGYTWVTIAAVLFCSSRTIDRWQQRFRQGRLPALVGNPRGRPCRFDPTWIDRVRHWVTTCTPRVFGFFRSRWCCAVLVLVLWQQYRVRVSQETVRRWLHRAELVWRRPRPVLRRQDPDKDAKWQAIRQLLLTLPEDETVVFLDEVDEHLNPDIGFMWMPKGEQAEVVTPGDNQKRYLAGSLHWRTGNLIPTVGPKRNTTLFLNHLDDVRRSLRRYRTIHVILDNAKFHDSERVAEWYGKWYGRVKFHFLPKYAPQLNPIERVWWHLREEITRNHTCQTIEELIDLTLHWLQNASPFEIEGSAYEDLQPI
jgi:putative transposase